MPKLKRLPLLLLVLWSLLLVGCNRFESGERVMVVLPSNASALNLGYATGYVVSESDGMVRIRLAALEPGQSDHDLMQALARGGEQAVPEDLVQHYADGRAYVEAVTHTVHTLQQAATDIREDRVTNLAERLVALRTQTETIDAVELTNAIDVLDLVHREFKDTGFDTKNPAFYAATARAYESLLADAKRFGVYTAAGLPEPETPDTHSARAEAFLKDMMQAVVGDMIIADRFDQLMVLHTHERLSKALEAANPLEAFGEDRLQEARDQHLRAAKARLDYLFDKGAYQPEHYQREATELEERVLEQLRVQLIDQHAGHLSFAAIREPEAFETAYAKLAAALTPAAEALGVEMLTAQDRERLYEPVAQAIAQAELEETYAFQRIPHPFDRGASHRDIVEAAKRYLERYPNGIFVAEVSERLAAVNEALDERASEFRRQLLARKKRNCDNDNVVFNGRCKLTVTRVGEDGSLDGVITYATYRNDARIRNKITGRLVPDYEAGVVRLEFDEVEELERSGFSDNIMVGSKWQLTPKRGVFRTRFAGPVAGPNNSGGHEGTVDMDS